MARSKPPILALSELVPGQLADFFALLIERTRGATREGKPYFLCRFRDRKRTVSFMVWSDGRFYEECDKVWRDHRFYKLRATYSEHERYGPQIDLVAIRPTTDDDRADGFDPAEFVEHSRFDREQMFQELRGLAEANISDEPLRRLVLGLLDRHAEPLKNRPATVGKFHPFAGGLLEHTLSVTKNCLWLAERYAVYYPELKPPLNRDRVVASAILHDFGKRPGIERRRADPAADRRRASLRTPVSCPRPDPRCRPRAGRRESGITPAAGAYRRDASDAPGMGLAAFAPGSRVPDSPSRRRSRREVGDVRALSHPGFGRGTIHGPRSCPGPDVIQGTNGVSLSQLLIIPSITRIRGRTLSAVTPRAATSAE